MLESPAIHPPIRLPYEFGEIVYHRARVDRIAGIVVGFIALPGTVKVYVRWGNDMDVLEHWQNEISSEYEPPFL